MHRRTALAGAAAGAVLALFPVLGRAQSAPTAQTVVGVISNDRDLDMLASLLIAADLVDTLQESGPFTVFAPRNAAFDDLGEATLTDLVAEDNAERLRRLLMHHVVPKRLGPEALEPGATHDTLAGTTIKITEDVTLRIGRAELVQPGLDVPNGFVHKIGSVLQPPEAA